jgi:DNA polymerase-1
MGRKETIYLVDGTGLVYRAHFAFISRPLRTRSGRDVSALYGFAHTLMRLLEEQKPRFLAVAFDTAAPTFRHEAFEAYKATRPEVPPEIVDQIPEVKRFLDCAGIRRLEQEGVEADDLIGSLARRFAAEGHDVVIVSADKDLMQLVGPRIRQLIPAKGKEPARWMGPREVEAKWGVPPPRLRDLLALVGDSSDNVPGVPGIGPKRAAELLQKFPDLDAIYAHLDEVSSPSVRRRLEENREQAFLSRELVTIREGLAPELRLEDMAVPDLADREELRAFLREFEFRSLEALLGSPTRAAARSAAFETWTVADRRGLERLREALEEGEGPAGIVAMASGPVARKAGPAALAFALGPGRVALCRVGAGGVAPEALEAELGAWLRKPSRPLVTHGAKTLLHLLANAGCLPEAVPFDTHVASYVLDPDRRHDLGALAKEFLDLDLPPEPESSPRGLFGGPEVGEPEAESLAHRARACLLLEPELRRLLREREQEALLEEIELPLARILRDMEAFGVALETKVLERMAEEIRVDLARLEEKAHAQAGQRFNLNSPVQLREILFEKLKLPPKKKTKTGYSTDSEVLEALAELHPLPRTLLEYRQLSKIQSTYVEVLPKLVDPDTGRLHATFHQTVTATGRLSSSDPNLQNVPIRGPLGRRIREAFVAGAPDGVLLSADYSQIELRILAHLSGDSYLIEAFRQGQDIHRATAARIFDVPPEKVDDRLRSRAKVANYGIIYGMGANRLAVEMGLTVPEARRFIEEYLARLPGVRDYLKRAVEEGRAKGFVTTLLGRRRYLPDLNSGDQRLRSQAERMAVNTPIQGSAADLIKKAMVTIHRELRRRGLEARLVLQIHDELLLELPAGEREEVGALVREAMEGVARFSVPLVVDMGWGRSWWDAHG